MIIDALRSSGIVVSLSLALAFGFSADAGSIEVIVLGSSAPGATDGTPLPDAGGFFRSPNAPASGGGAIAFQSWMTATPTFELTGVFRYVDGVLQTVARDGDPVPGTGGVLPLLVNRPLVNGPGDVACDLRLVDIVGGSNGIGVVLRYPVDDVDPITIARAGQAPPVGDGVFSDSFQAESVNAAGEVAFVAGLSNTTNDTAIYRGDGMTTVQVARGGEPAPIDGVTFGWLLQSQADMNAAGDVAFTAVLEGGPPSGLFLWDRTEIRTIAARGDQLPSGSEINYVTDMAISDDGNVAFRVSLVDENTSEIYRGNGGPLTPIMMRGASLPDLRGQFGTAGGMDMNAGSEVAFSAGLTGTAGGEYENRGIFVGDGTTTREIAREGDVPPNGGDREFHTFRGPNINDAGQVAFVADLRTAGGPPDAEGLFFWDPGAGLIEIIREGDPIAGGALSSLFFASETPRFRGLGDDGKVAFQFRADVNGRTVTGLAVWSPPPPCFADLDGSGAVGFADLQMLLQAWGTDGPANVDGNGTVGFNDLGLLLNAWGACF